MNKHLAIVIIVVTIFMGYLLGYSLSPYFHAGVFSEREEKGVEVKIDKEMEEYYQNLLQGEE
jgi:hypothetical protein